MADVFPFVDFPVGVLRWRRLGAVIDGGGAVAGPGQIAKTDGGGWWGCELSGGMIRTQAERWAFNALLLALDDGLGLVELPYLEETPLTGTARLSGARALRATTIGIERLAGWSGPVKAGMAFDIDNSQQYRRLHMIKKVVSTAGNVDTVEIRPPLRQAASDDKALGFAAPRCLMRLDDPNGDVWPRMTGTWTGEWTARFVEAFPPPPA